MKKLRRGTALVLSIALVFSLVAVAASPNWSDLTSLGLLSRYYETGETNTDVEAAKMISTVDGDPGGKSYGAYMFASKSGTVKAFIEWCCDTSVNPANTVTYAIGEKLSAAYYSGGEGCGPLFDQAWIEAAADYGSAFFTVQENYVKSDIYDVAIELIRKTYPQFNVNNYSVALKNVIWSRAVHHGPSGAANVVVRAFNSLGGFSNQSESELILAIYHESGRVVTPEELKAENGATAAVMYGSMADKYAVDGNILRYWYGSSGRVQASVYRRLGINEPADALGMMQQNAFVNAPLSEGNYHIALKMDNSTLALGVADNAVKVVNTAGDNALPAAKFTLHYLSGAGVYTIETVMGEDTMRLAAGTADAEGFGSVTLTAPSTSDTQLWYVDSSGSLKNKATDTYLAYRNDTLVVVGPDGADTTQTITAVPSDADTMETFTQVLPEGSEETPKTLNVTFITGENGTIAEDSTASFVLGTSADFTVETLHDVTAKEGWTFTGWFTENGMEVKSGAIGAAGELKLYARYTATSTVAPSLWTFTPVVAELSDITLQHLIYPNEEAELHYKDSGFPVRGLISCSAKISNVTLAIRNENGVNVSGAYASVSPNATSYDLSNLDSSIAYSKLKEGEYTFSLSAKVGGKTFVLAESAFSVGPALEDAGDSENYTVTFDAGEHGTCRVETETYSLDSIVYGALPEVSAKSGWGFAGWFTADDVEILPGTQIVAEDITLYAKYTKVYTYTFLNAAGNTYTSGTTAAGTLFDAPSQAPVKSPDSQYTYKFSHWLDEENIKYYSGETIIMGEGDMTFTPVYTKTAYSGGESGGSEGGSGGSGSTGGSSSPTPSGAYWIVTPGTTVSQLDGTVYKGSTVVTTGNLTTGMTVDVGGVLYTIAVTGDASGDGKISVTDVVRLQEHLLNKRRLTGAHLEAADLNDDGKVTITDLVKSARVVAGKDTIR